MSSLSVTRNQLTNGDKWWLAFISLGLITLYFMVYDFIAKANIIGSAPPSGDEYADYWKLAQAMNNL